MGKRNFFVPVRFPRRFSTSTKNSKIFAFAPCNHSLNMLYCLSVQTLYVSYAYDRSLILSYVMRRREADIEAKLDSKESVSGE